MKTTTLRKIRECNPCISSWKRLLEGLGKSEADDEPLPYSKILGICGLHDALWATRTEEDFRWVQELALRFARHVSHLMADPRSIRALDVAEKFLAGEAGREELEEALKEAYDAVTEDVPPVSYAAASCAYCTAYYSTSSSASDSSLGAYDATRCAVNIAYGKSYYFKGPSEREWQEAEFRRVVS